MLEENTMLASKRKFNNITGKKSNQGSFQDIIFVSYHSPNSCLPPLHVDVVCHQLNQNKPTLESIQIVNIKETKKNYHYLIIDVGLCKHVQGRSAIVLRLAGFHVERMILRSSRLCFILLITSKAYQTIG